MAYAIDGDSVVVSSSALPTGAATAAKQLADNHQVQVSASALPTGAATSAKQLADNHQVIVSASALPTGAATAAKQLPDGHNVVVSGPIIAPSNPTAAYGASGVRVIIGPTDPISNIPVFMPYDHHQIHEGEAWHYDSYVVNLASGTSYDIVFTVPNITIPAGISVVERVPHLRYSIDTTDLATAFLYEAPTVTGGTGTAASWINFERNGTYTAKTTILLAPTVTAVGTLIDSEYFMQAAVGQVSGGGSGGTVEEFMLKNNTKYLFRITSGAAGCDIHTDFFMYEDLGV